MAHTIHPDVAIGSIWRVNDTLGMFIVEAVDPEVGGYVTVSQVHVGGDAGNFRYVRKADGERAKPRRIRSRSLRPSKQKTGYTLVASGITPE